MKLLIDGGLWVDANGYVRHGKDKYVHRTVMEGIVGRKLESFEQVHHKDHNKQNNDPANLVLCVQAAHSLMHAHERIEEAGGQVGTHLYCTYHECVHPIAEFSTNPNMWSGYHNVCKAATNDYRKKRGLTLRENRPNKWLDNLGQQYRRAKKNTKVLISWLEEKCRRDEAV